MNAGYIVCYDTDCLGMRTPEVKSWLGEAARIWAASRCTQERHAKEVLDLLSGVLTREKILWQIPSN